MTIATTLLRMSRVWLLALAQVALTAGLRVVGHTQASGLAVTLALWMLGWLAAGARRGDR